MAASDYLFSSRVAIFGLGLMGGSLALALRDRCQSLLAIDPDPETIALARRRHIVDHITPHPTDQLDQADVIFLAAPVNTILEIIADLPALHPGGSPVVIDLGSSKTQICQALEGLPERFDPIGGHPMCGKETSSLANAEATLFHGAVFAFTPLARTSPRARTIAEQLARSIGSRPLWIDPDTHDQWTAATSHLPYLLASALALATPTEAAPLIGTGFQSTSRLATSPASMMSAILTSNQDNVLEALERFRDQLDLLESCLTSGETGTLIELLSQSASRRETLLDNAQGEGRI
jgi:prephenate dehydrogenase